MSSKEKTNVKPEEPKSEIVPQQGTALQTVDFGEDAGSGLENVSAAELKIPFLNLLQPLSPQCKPVTAGGMPGAQPGMILNGGTGELYDPREQPLVFMPVERDHMFLEFTPRNLGGGFVSMYTPDDEKILRLRADQGKFGKLITGTGKRNDKGELLDGTEIMETFSLYGLFQDPNGGWFRAVLSFKSTQIRKYQGFMGRVTQIKYANPKSTDNNPLPPVTPPMWAHQWDLKTVYESNSKGEFYGFNLSLHGKKPDGSEDVPFKSLVPRSEQLYQDAKGFYQMLKEGKAKADFATDNKAGEAEGSKPGQDDGVPM